MLFNLPYELQLKILGYLSVEDLFRLKLAYGRSVNNIIVDVLATRYHLLSSASKLHRLKNMVKVTNYNSYKSIVEYPRSFQTDLKIFGILYGFRPNMYFISDGKWNKIISRYYKNKYLRYLRMKLDNIPETNSNLSASSPPNPPNSMMLFRDINKLFNYVTKNNLDKVFVINTDWNDFLLIQLDDLRNNFKLKCSTYSYIPFYPFEITCKYSCARWSFYETP